MVRNLLWTDLDVTWGGLDHGVGHPALGRRGGRRGGDDGNTPRILLCVRAALRAAERSTHEEKADGDATTAARCLMNHRAFLTLLVKPLCTGWKSRCGVWTRS